MNTVQVVIAASPYGTPLLPRRPLPSGQLGPGPSGVAGGAPVEHVFEGELVDRQRKDAQAPGAGSADALRRALRQVDVGPPPGGRVATQRTQEYLAVYLDNSRDDTGGSGRQSGARIDAYV